MSKDASSPTSCAEKGVWTPVPTQPPADTTLSLKSIDPDEDARIATAAKMTFHMTGCTGDFDDGTSTVAVAGALCGQSDSSFLYHLGDITYTDKKEADGLDQFKMYNGQFLAPYTNYKKSIVAIGGNHDGKNSPVAQQSAVQTFLANFCADPKQWPAKWPHNTIDSRPAMIQPYPFWRFDTTLAYFIGLYANISNGGILDDPSAFTDYTKGPQYQWLVGQLKDVKQRNEANSPKRAVLVTVHYPPYSGASNFNVRGDPQAGQSANESNAPYLAVSLQQAFSDSGQRADALFSAHAHLFQRLTYTFADGTVMPCLVVGCGGHSIEDLFEECDGTKGPKQQPPFPAVAPGSFQFPNGESAQVDAFEDKKHNGMSGFIQVQIESRALTCTFYDTSGAAGDSFELDLDKHQYKRTSLFCPGRAD